MALVGKRIRELRGAGMTQTELAASAGVSVDIVRKLEQGRRHTASISTLTAIARALDVSLAELLSKSTNLPAGPDTGVVAVRRALTSIDDLLATEDPSADGEPVDIASTRRTVDFAWGHYWTGRYAELARLLPEALVRTRAALRESPVDTRPVVADLATQLYDITASTLVHLGQPDAAHLALRDATVAASVSFDALRAAAVRRTAAWVLLTEGRYAEAVRLAQDAARRIAPGAGASPDAVRLWASLLVTTATAAGRDGQRAVALDLLDEAARAVERVGGTDQDAYDSPIGPAQLAMQTVDVHIVSDDYDAALAAAGSMTRQSALPLAARARHLTDLALAHLRTSDWARAESTLLAIERLAPQWLLCQALPRQVTRELLESGRGSRELRQFAQRIDA